MTRTSLGYFADHLAPSILRRSGAPALMLLVSLGTLLAGAVAADAAEPLPGYDRFVQARQLQQQGNHSAAIKAFAEIDQPPLVQAARCAAAVSLIAVGKPDQAAEQLQAVVDAKPNLYRGEALYGLAYLHCWNAKSQNDFRQIAAQLEAALHFCRQNFDDARAFDLDPATFDALRQQNGPGKYDPALACAGTLVNPVSTDWYIPQLKAKILLLRVYVASQLHDAQQLTDAADALEALAAQSHYVPCDQPTMIRLRAEGASGSFVIPPAVWQDLPENDGPAIRFALFLTISPTCPELPFQLPGPGSLPGARAEALRVFQRLDQQIQARGDTGEIWAVVHLGQALCLWQLGQTDQAVAKLDRFTSLFRQSRISDIGQLTLANLLCGEPKGYAQAVRLYHTLADRDPNSALAAHAMLCLAIAAAEHKDFDQVVSATDYVAKHHPRSEYASAAAAMASLASGGRVTGTANRSSAKTRESIRTIEVSLPMSGWNTPSALHQLPGSGSGSGLLPGAGVMIFRVTVRADLPQSRVESWRVNRMVIEPRTLTQQTQQAVFYRSPPLWQPFWTQTPRATSHGDQSSYLSGASFR
ncbi:MAG: hypothetical protein WC058_02170 [Phycisphaeraceae bacterium]